MNVIQAAAPKRRTALNNGKKELDFYTEIPSCELSIDEFEDFAVARLKVLRKLERLKIRNLHPDVRRVELEKSIRENLATPEIDRTSHFILRAAYSRSEDMRRWFLAQECSLLKHRLEQLHNVDASDYALDGSSLSIISRREQERLSKPLQQLVPSGEFHKMRFYRVPFTMALELVASRQCYLQGGEAYVPQTKAIPLIVAQFRMRLSRSLVMAQGAAGGHYDPRLDPLLQNVSHVHIPSQEQDTAATAISGVQLTAQTLPKYVKHMPLCMSQLQAGLKQDKKLKHLGRLQYGLFLKGAGLSMEEALTFFQQSFSNLTADEFQKNYAYSIRHMHGREGKRANYSAYSCVKIIMGQAPSAGEHHGCPFRHYDVDHLTALLRSQSIQDVAPIVALKQAGHFQLACFKHFDALHPIMDKQSDAHNDLGNHPNAWFAASVAYHQERNGTNSSGNNHSG